MKTMKARKAKGAYRMKRMLPMVALVAAGLMTACDKNKNNDPYAGPMDPVKVLPFGDNGVGYDSISYDNVMKYANDPRITKIIYFLDSTNNNDYTGRRQSRISDLRKQLQERLDYTPKATGAGTFIFLKGRALPEDSLWFIANGWKIRTR